MKWITRSHVHVDRVACPWLITRFIDAEAEFLFVPTSQIEKVVKETENHYALIEDEYMHVMKMVDKSDQDIYVRE